MASVIYPSSYPHQEKAAKKLRTGSILWGGVGSGKSRTAVLYYAKNEYPKDLYIITTAAKRDKLDWEHECSAFDLYPKAVDSWNNIKKYIDVKNSFFIFDEQRVVGSGSWVKSFLKIVKNNPWILLSATPGDTWMDYIPVFIANGFYKNRTQFIREHVVYVSFLKFPKIDRYVGTQKLRRLKDSITVKMDYKKPTERIFKEIKVQYDEKKYDIVWKKRWNIFNEAPIKEVSELFYAMRRVVNSDPSRLSAIRTLIDQHSKIIVFYNFNYELEILRSISLLDDSVTVAEYNGHKHEPIPSTTKWVYLVQYMSGAEGWNCTETNTIAFYSQNYSYRMMTQAAGRIDRLNTPFSKLFYYSLVSNSMVDKAIKKALHNKKTFNELVALKSDT